MKMKRYILLIFSVFLTAGFLNSCTWELLPDAGEGDSVLMLSPALLDMQDNALKTRALSEDELKDDQFNEDKVSRLDVFIFKTDGTFVTDYHIGDLTPDMIVQLGGKEGYLLSRDWKKDGLDTNIPYKVYVVANSTNETITTPLAAGSTITEATLKALYTHDENIYKRYLEGAAADDATYSPDKTFLMNATVDSWTIPNMATQLIGDKTLTLERAAVKFVLDISLTSTFKARLAADNTEYGTPSWKYVNFKTVTPELLEGTVPEDVNIPLATRESSGYLTAVPGAVDGHYIVTTYAYPQEWTADTANDIAPAILLSYPAVNNTTHVSNYHYYYIPLCAAGVVMTERNKLYKATGLISSYGSFETLTEDTVNLTYEVKDWTSSSADVNAYAMDYLMVTPTRYSFKGGNTGESLSETIRYYSSGAVTISGVRAYYKNRTGQETAVTDGFTVGDPANGKIVVTSTVPTNGTFRTLEFTVNGSGGKSEKVIIRHYPADYVTGISASYSSYNLDSWAVPGQSKSYNSSLGSGETLTFSNNGTYSFRARMWYNNNIYTLNANGTAGSTASGVSNNQMYALQITSANDQYRLGRPNLTTNTATVNGSTVTYFTSNDDVLSPAFIIASQLGVISGNNSLSKVASAIHCALYKEVADDGTVFSEWRLPTKKEVAYMIYNQYHNSNVMIDVLIGQFYWTLDGGTAENTEAEQDSKICTRCVRDLTAEEIAKLNNF